MYSLSSAALQYGLLSPLNCGATTLMSPRARVPFSTAEAGAMKLLEKIAAKASGRKNLVKDFIRRVYR